MPIASILKVMQAAKIQLIDLSNIKSNKTLTQTIFTEAGQFLDELGEGSLGVFGEVNGDIGQIFKTIGNGGSRIINKAKGSIMKTLRCIWDILKVSNEVWQWGAIVYCIFWQGGEEVFRRKITNTKFKREEMGVVDSLMRKYQQELLAREQESSMEMMNMQDEGQISTKDTFPIPSNDGLMKK